MAPPKTLEAPRWFELCWLDPKRAPRIRNRPPWRRVIDEAAHPPAETPPDAEAEPAATPYPEDPALPNQNVPPDDRRDVLLVLTRAEPIDADGVSAAIAEGVRDDGKFAPPLVLVAGELRLPFDELETLKVTITTATPFIPGDETLKAAVVDAKEFLAIPDLSPAPVVVEAMITRVREAFGRIKRAVPPGYLDAQTERALLEQRRYQKRTFDGKPHLRAVLQGPSDKSSMLVYLPEAAADKLPLFQRFGARLIAEASLAVDQFETHPYALDTLALARVLPAIARKA